MEIFKEPISLCGIKCPLVKIYDRSTYLLGCIQGTGELGERSRGRIQPSDEKQGVFSESLPSLCSKPIYLRINCDKTQNQIRE